MIVPFRDVYGTRESNGLLAGSQYHEERARNHAGTVDWTYEGLRITRLRLLSDPGYPHWDVSYCHGLLPDGRHVDVRLPFSELRKWHKSLKQQIVEYAIQSGISAKRTGILDVISTLN